MYDCNYILAERGRDVESLVHEVTSHKRDYVIQNDIMLAFVGLREAITGNQELARQFDDLERRMTQKLDSRDQAIVGILKAFVN